jgi:hypothetical protein
VMLRGGGNRQDENRIYSRRGPVHCKEPMQAKCSSQDLVFSVTKGANPVSQSNWSVLDRSERLNHLLLERSTCHAWDFVAPAAAALLFYPRF